MSTSSSSSTMAAMDFCVANAPHNTYDSGVVASALDMMEIDTPKPRSMEDILPEAMITEILSRVSDARDLIRCALVNRFFRASFVQAKTVRFTFRLENFRKGAQGSSPPAIVTPFKEAVARTVTQLTGVEDLRIEIEDEMQAQKVKEDQPDRNSLWLSEETFVRRWLTPGVCLTLQRLCVIDYGQQAIFKTSPLLQALSKYCPNLQKVELRNMFLDATECSSMKKMECLTLRCVKLMPSGLKDISQCMPNLQTLTLVTVVGIKEAELSSTSLKVLCLGFATRVTSVKLDVRSLIKLQLKTAPHASPETLKVKAPNLKSLALCVGQNRVLNFENVTNLEELLMGTAEFSSLVHLSAINRSLKKIFLDIPCMSFEESGKLRTVLSTVPLNVPDMETIRSCCPKLETLSMGPGLWHSLEKGMIEKDLEGCIVLPKWPQLKSLVLHLIVQDEYTSLNLITALLRAMPTLKNLEVYVHKSSKVGPEEFSTLLESYWRVLCPQLHVKFDTWLKGLQFGCFSF